MPDSRTRLVLDTLLPSHVHPTLTTGLLDAGFDDFWSAFERTAPPTPRRAFRAAVLAATWLAPVLIGRLPPLGRHDRPTRERALAALGASRVPLLRQLMLVLKMLASLAYGADPAVRQVVGYPRSPLKPRAEASS
jgi:hypothetical protein